MTVLAGAHNHVKCALQRQTRPAETNAVRVKHITRQTPPTESNAPRIKHTQSHTHPAEWNAPHYSSSLKWLHRPILYITSLARSSAKVFTDTTRQCNKTIVSICLGFTKASTHFQSNVKMTFFCWSCPGVWYFVHLESMCVIQYRVFGSLWQVHAPEMLLGRIGRTHIYFHE